MDAVDIDLELLDWIGNFIRERKRVTVDDVRREFFPGEIGAPYPYLDQLTAEGQLLVVPGDTNQRTTWMPTKKREQQRRSRWGQFMDGEVHELTAEEIQELTGESTTPHQFERRLRAHAHNYGLKCSAKSTENGIRFAIGGSADMDSEVSDYLPREVAAQDGWGSLRAVVLSTTDGRPHTTHAMCTHPATRNERDKCRRWRKARA